MEKETGTYRALIVAAGCSRRMKTFKQLLMLGDKTLLEHSISRFIEAGIKDIVVVVGCRKDELIPILNRLGVQIVVNELFDQKDMLESVKCGLRVMPADTRGILLSPADIPLIHPDTIRNIVEAAKLSEAFAVIPSNEGHAGHPLLFGRRIQQEILKYEGENGIHSILNKFAKRIDFINVEDSDMLMDIDRPEDYQKLLEVYEKQNK
ncbi:MAG: nucleotidyltransferase family protein [Mobilitalea sp.]